MSMNLLILLLTTILFESCGSPSQEVRLPTVSGYFYSSDPQELSATVQDFMAKAEQIPFARTGKLWGLIVPHAGYEYSGEVAGYAYGQLKGNNFDTVVLIGPSHRHAFRGVSVGDYTSYQTPLELVPVNRELVKGLINSHELISFYHQAHDNEHSIEVQLPFLQSALSNFKIVPILMGDISLHTCQVLANTLYDVCKNKNILFIATSDLSHFYPYSQAIEIDNKTIEAITSFNAELLFTGIINGNYELCGASPVITLLLLAKRLEIMSPLLLKYMNSGDVYDGNKLQVVGYSSFILYESK